MSGSQWAEEYLSEKEIPILKAEEPRDRLQDIANEILGKLLSIKYTFARSRMASLYLKHETKQKAGLKCNIVWYREVAPSF